MATMKRNRDYAWWVEELYWCAPIKPSPSWMGHIRYLWRKLKWKLITWAIVPNAEGYITVGYRTHKVEGWVF